MSPRATVQRNPRRVFLGIAGGQRADDMEIAMREARRRARRQAEQDREPSRADRRKLELGGAGHASLQKLAEKIGAHKEPKPQRAGAERAEERELGPRVMERFVEGPSSNWTERR